MSPSFINELAKAEMGKGNGMVVVHRSSLENWLSGHWSLAAICRFRSCKNRASLSR